jgi:hypothetical protein
MNARGTRLLSSVVPGSGQQMKVVGWWHNLEQGLVNVVSEIIHPVKEMAIKAAGDNFVRTSLVFSFLIFRFTLETSEDPQALITESSFSHCQELGEQASGIPLAVKIGCF